jgi:hypothetical protein
MKSRVVWVVTPCITERTRHFGVIYIGIGSSETSVFSKLQGVETWKIVLFTLKIKLLVIITEVIKISKPIFY